MKKGSLKEHEAKPNLETITAATDRFAISRNLRHYC